MLNEKLAGKLRTIHSELSTLSNEIFYKIDNVDKNADPNISVYIKGIKKCLLSFKKSLEILEDSNEFYKKDIEIKGGHTSLDYIRHDMINPISGIKGYSEIILESSTDQYVVINIEGIISIINNILDLISHIEVTD
jgi:hypothetical protein